MLNLYEMTNPVFGKVFNQISAAWHLYAPKSVTWVDSIDKADFVILEVVGGLEYDLAKTIPDNKRINFQQCYYTSGVQVELWHDLWTHSYATISFHDLKSYTDADFRFYRTPLGAEPTLFPYLKLPRTRKVFTTGHVAETECIDKVYEAVKDTSDFMYHTGEDFRWGGQYKHLEYMTIPELARWLNQTQFVAGLRDIEGFEVLCMQGAMCGATPIIPNLPSYDYYKDFGIFIDMKQDVVAQLKDIFNNYTPLSEDKIKYIRYRFSWERIMHDLYKSLFF